MIDFNTLFKSFESKKVLIIGDIMIDSYMWGISNRISPEAPVPIVEIEKYEKKLGGAGNVALHRGKLVDVEDVHVVHHLQTCD